ncbi:MAG TPA: intermembrane transport protein PqiB [Chthoniobacterales bacterium]
MTEQPQPDSPVIPEAPVRRRTQRLSAVWIIPIVAALLGAWLVWQHYFLQGPTVQITFDTAEGIEAGKTVIQCRSVAVGLVQTVRLKEDLKGVITKVRIDRSAAELLHKDTRFWVVRARVGESGISGLSTLVSGSYIELDPGTSKEQAYAFEGLEEPPITPQGVPGLHVTLVADQAGSLGPGSSVTYKGLKAGKIESRTFDPVSGQVKFGAFIQGDYGKLITDKTHFWNVSGVDLRVGADGVRLRTGTLDSLISGGISFDVPPPGVPSQSAVDGQVFPLYESFDETQKVILHPRMTFLLLFENSVRGLTVGAPVEFRGIQVGTVTGISFAYVPDNPLFKVPVLISVDPAPITHNTLDDLAAITRNMENNVRRGLRATLKTGSLLTGQLFVDLDFLKDAPPAQVEEIAGYKTIPTISSGLGRLEDKIVGLLDKIQALPLDETVTNANGALAEIRDTAAQTKKLLGSDGTQALPGELKQSLSSLRETLSGFDQNSAFYRDLSQTLQDLNEAIRSIDSLSRTIERKPNSLLFGLPTGDVQPPKAKKP